MAAPEVAVTFRVACPDGSVRHDGAFVDYRRAAHWAMQPGTGCCFGVEAHHVIPVVAARAVQTSRGVR